MDCFLGFNILDHICTTCFVFADLFGSSFSKSFANSQRYTNKISSSIFKIWNFLPLFQMLFLWLKQNSPSIKILLLVFKRVLDTNIESGHTNLKYINNKITIEICVLKIFIIRCQLKNFFLKNFKLVVVRSFCFGLILSPPLAWIAKNGYFVSEIWALLFSP
jgi:hypothetical protein